VRFGVTDLAYATRGLLYGDEALWLPEWFRAAAQGSYDTFAQAYVERARRLDGQIAPGVHLGVYCAEDLPFVDWSAATASAAGTRIGTYLIDQYRAACAVWPKGTLPADFREPVRSAVPTLLMSGRRDPVSPSRGASEAARTLSASRMLVWPYGGHATDGLAGGDCRMTILREFVRSADPARLPVDCMTQQPRPFRTPARPE
jgi:pimeloyl-ACP methyl ester carboxylesterase